MANLFDDLDLGTAAGAAAPSAAQNMFDSVIPSADFSNVSGGATPPETQEQPKPVSDPTGLKNLFDDVMAFPENFATGAKAIWEGGDYQGDPNDKREVLSPAEGFARRFTSGLASLPGMALEASPIGLTEKLARMAAEKAGVTLPDWVTPTTTLAREANEGINKNIGIDEETMRYVGPRTEFFTNVAADVASNFVPLGPAVKAEVAAKNAYETASAAGAKPWDATAEALSAIKKTAAEPPQAAKAPPSWQDLYTNLERAETPEQAQAASATLDSSLKGNMFDDIVPEAPRSPVEARAAEPTVSEPVGQEAAPAPVGEASAPLSDVAARIKEANEKSLQETGAPLNAEQIKAIREEGAELPAPLPAYHGTPHEFDKFSIQKIGTGEGVQAYGHGLYFAGSRAVAEHYRERLTQANNIAPDRMEQYFQPGRIVDGYGGKDKVVKFHPGKDGRGWSVDVIRVDKNGEPVQYERVRNHATYPSRKEVESVLGPIKEGNLYGVEIKPKDEDFLNWDKPINEQSPHVQSALEGLGYFGEGRSIKEGYRKLAADLGGPEMASAKLQEVGVPGIRYLDGNSRDKGQGSHNYVIFDDKNVEITHKNDQPVSAPTATGAKVNLKDDPTVKRDDMGFYYRDGKLVGMPKETVRPRTQEELQPQMVTPEERAPKQRLHDFVNTNLNNAQKAWESLAKGNGPIGILARKVLSDGKDRSHINVKAVSPEDLLKSREGTEQLIGQNWSDKNGAPLGIFTRKGPNGEQVYIRGAGFKGDGLAPEVMAHELMHSELLGKIGELKKLHDQIADGATDHLHPQTKQALEAYRELERVREALANHPDLKPEGKGTPVFFEHAVSNVDELTSVAMTDPAFRRFLKDTKVGAVTAWSKIKDAWAKMLGLGRTEKNIIDHITDQVDVLLKYDPEAAARKPVNELGWEMAEPRAAAPRKSPYKTATASPKEDIPIVPKWQRTLASFISWKGGKRFAEPMERAKLESATSDFHADRAAKLFDKAGLKKMSPEERANVRAALHGDTKASISPAMREAVDFTRNQIAEYQARLATMDVKMEGRDLTDMFYESMAKGDYVTRAFNIFESQPTALKKALYAMSGAEELGKPYYRWESEKHRPETVEAFKKYLMENLVDKTKPIEPQLEDLLNQFSDPKGPGTNIEVVKQAARDSSILKSRVNVPEPVKRYWGEIKDPRLEAALTLSRIGTLTAKQAMLVRMAKEGNGKYFFEDGQQPQGFTEKLPSNSDYGPLSGKYTRPDIADELKTTIGIEKDNPAKAPEKMLRAAWDAYTFLGSSVKILKTVGSATTQAVNWYSNTFLIAKVSVQHALMGKMLGLPEISKAISTNMRDLFGKLTKEEADILISSGILRDGVQFGELKKIRSKVEREVAHEGAKPTMKALYKVKDAGNWLLHTAGDIYQLADNVPRMTFFLGEMAIQKQLHPKWTRQQLIEYSANKARDEVPTYGRASPTVKAISKVEANFTTWSGEVVRTTANQIRNGLNDLKNGETAAQKYYGFAQLMGTSAYIAGASTVLPQAIQMFFGFKTDDKKKNEAMSKLAPDFLAGDDLAVAHADPKTGKVVYMDSTRLDPSGPFHTLWNREMEAIRKEGLKTPASKVGGAAFDWLIDTFASFGPLPQTAKTIITGKNQYNTELSPDERVAEVGKMLKPGTQMTVEKYNALKKRGVDERVLKATMAGLPLYDVDTQQNMRGSGYRLSDEITSYKQQFNRAYGNADATPEEQKEAYIDFLRNEKAEWDKVHDQVKAFQTIFGEKDGKKLAIDSLKSAKINKDYLAAFETGKFKPDNLEESKTFMDSQEAKAIRNDPSHEADIRKDFAKRRYQLTRLRLNYEQYIK